MGTTTDTVPPRVGDDAVVFHVTDPQHRLHGVRLWQTVGLPRSRTVFARTGSGWTLRVSRPPVDRMEYLFDVRRDGGGELVPDGGNPLRVGSAFGDHSVVEFPGYAVPWWLAAPRGEGMVRDVAVEVGALGGTMRASVWSPAGVTDTDPLPLLVVHDGPEYDALGGLTTYSAALVEAGTLPPHRVALLAPGQRNDWYSANPAYATALCFALLPTVERAVAVRGQPVGVGVSLGALAMLHAQRRHPGTFGGLFLQSGSFFLPLYDHMEAGFERFTRIVRWVSATRRASFAPARVPVVLTCGTVEENLRNNRLMCRTLAGQGYRAELVENRDAHNYTGWRDCLDPHLTNLLREVWDAT